jgi:hypothetical protein
MVVIAERFQRSIELLSTSGSKGSQPCLIDHAPCGCMVIPSQHSQTSCRNSRHPGSDAQCSSWMAMSWSVCPLCSSFGNAAIASSKRQLPTRPSLSWRGPTFRWKWF